ncbi:Mitochondrial sorting-like protein [Aphelenchoides bicaudatus]|nr:Mitochondrial sorting-like protein [Aphelenchoides bicaudatus]
MSSSSFRSELISICLRVGAAAVISYVSIKYMVKFLDPNYQLKQEAKKKVEELLQRLDIDFPLELNEYELRIATQLVPPDQGVSWNEVGGYENVINDLKNRVIKPLQARANNRLPAGSSLLTPAPWNFAVWTAGISARARFIQLDISCLTDKWYGESQKLAAAVFSLAQKLQPCIVFIDEVDAFLRRRDSCDNEATAMMKAQFMSLWDGFSSGDNAVIIMGATNRPNDVDAAILRRMPIKFHVQLPNETAREAIFETILRNEYVEPDVNYKKLAKLTHGHSGSDLKEICRIAAMSRLNDADGSDVEWIEPAAITIREEDLVQAVVKYSSDTLPPTFNQLFIDEVE